MAAYVPHHGFQSQFPRDSERCRPSSSKRRAKQIRVLSDCVLQSLMAIGELGMRLCCGFENEPRMREGVIADDVSCLRHRARNIRALLQVAADYEKRRSHTVLGQHIEQLQRVRIVWPIVVGQCDLLASTDSSGKRPAIPLSCRRHGLVACGRGAAATAAANPVSARSIWRLYMRDPSSQVPSSQLRPKAKPYILLPSPGRQSTGRLSTIDHRYP